MDTQIGTEHLMLSVRGFSVKDHANPNGSVQNSPTDTQPPNTELRRTPCFPEALFCLGLIEHPYLLRNTCNVPKLLTV